MATTEFKTAPVGSWLKVADDLQNVIISHENTGAVHIHIGSVDPGAGSAYHKCFADNPFSMSGISGQDVYIRSGTTSPIQCTVTAI